MWDIVGYCRCFPCLLFIENMVLKPGANPSLYHRTPLSITSQTCLFGCEVLCILEVEGAWFLRGLLFEEVKATWVSEVEGAWFLRI